MSNEIKQRNQQKVEDTWNLADVYATKADWEADVAQVLALAQKVVQMKGKVADSAQNLLQVLEDTAKMGEKLGLTFHYASRMADEDKKNANNQEMEQRMYHVYAVAAEQTSFLNPEILAMEDALLDSFYQELPALEFYRKEIEEIIRLKPHSLSAESERLLAMTSEMSETPGQVYSIMQDADFIYPEITNEKGETERLSTGRFVPLLESSNRQVRKDAFLQFFSVQKQFIHTSAALYQGQLNQQMFHAKARNYNSTLEAAVDTVNVSPQVYYNLVETVNQNLDAMHRYVSLRKKILGVDELHMYDVYTPMIPNVARKIPFEEAKETVLKALAPLGEDYVAKLQEGFSNRWIDVYENEGKRSGAYSAGAYGVHPYVLLNYNDTLDAMFTLAHEMGHSLHTYYSNEAQPYIYSDYKIFVAEVASTCNEVLLMEYLLQNTTGKKERIYLLNHYLDNFKATVYRQTMFAEFEMESNRMAEAGESLTAEVLNKLYYDLNCKYYGPDMVSDPEIAYEWARIPHFYYNFYVYQYATGFSAAVAIARNILKEGAPAVERYKQFLSGGCSLPPVELLKIAGVDLTTPQPVQEALKIFGEILDEIETLV